MSNNPQKQITPSKGFFTELAGTVRLILRLMGDRRVSPLLKALPVGSLIYWISPLDLMPGIPIDDAALVLSAMYFFIEMCPPEVVAEHRAALSSMASGVAQHFVQPEDVIDAEYHETTSQPDWKSQGERRNEP
jgi:hypothetical protein